MAAHGKTITERSLLDVVEMIYRSVLEPEGWRQVLAEMAVLLDSQLTAVIVRDLRRDTTATVWSVNWDCELEKDYNRYYAQTNACWRWTHERIRAGQVMTASERISPGALRKTEFYSDYLRRIDSFHILAICLSRHETQVANLSTLRSERQEDFGDVERWAFQQLFPHLRNALAIQQKLQGESLRRLLVQEALDSLSIGVLFLGSEGKVLGLNRRAEEILDLCDGLRLFRRRLVASGRTEASSLSRILQAGCEGRWEILDRTGSDLAIGRPSGKRAFSLALTPLQGNQGDFPVIDVATRAVAFLTDPEDQPPLPYQVLMAHFGLTFAEARLASELVAGLSLWEISQELQVSINTVRSQLKSIFEKVGVRSQADLIRLLSRGLARATLRIPD